MRYLILVISILFFALPGQAGEDAPPPPPNAPPAWFMENIEHMTSDGGRWIADNADYKSEDETWDAYGLEWTRGPGGYSMSGHLFAIKDGVDTAEDFWTFSQYWDPASNSAIVEQYGWGSIGVGTMWRIDADDEVWMQQTFTSFDGSAREEAHRSSNTDENTHVTSSYSVDATGLWTKNRSYTWIRELRAE